MSRRRETRFRDKNGGKRGRRRRRSLVCIQLSIFRNDGAAEAVIHAGPQDVVGDVCTGGNRRKGSRAGERIVNGAEIHIEIFELGGPVAANRPFFELVLMVTVWVTSRRIFFIILSAALGGNTDSPTSVCDIMVSSSYSSSSI